MGIVRRQVTQYGFSLDLEETVVVVLSKERVSRLLSNQTREIMVSVIMNTRD